jgi:HlyD family secretion protein
MTRKKAIAAASALAALCAAAAFRLLSEREFLYAGTVEATEVEICARVSSVISAFPAEEGRPVMKGEALVDLACEDLRLAADIAKKDYDRAVQLRRGGSMPEEAFDRSRYKSDDAALKVAWCSIRSPIDATVLTTYREPGELVNPGTRLLTLADLSEVWAVVYVPQPLLASLRADMPVEALLPEMKGRVFRGRVAHINEEAEFTPKNVQTRQERTRLVFGVKVKFPNPDRLLKPGMTLEVRLPG